MIAVALGILCGICELGLLRYLVNHLTEKKVLIILPLKIFALVVFLTPIAIIWPQDLLLAGISTVSVIVVGAVAEFVYRGFLMKKDKQ